jgi:hypothetical protein
MEANSAPVTPHLSNQRHQKLLLIVPNPPVPQFDPVDRDGIEPPQVSTNKDGEYCCKKHASPSMCLYPQTPDINRNIVPFGVACNQCFGWKKQITRARTAAKKAGRK